MPERDSGWSLAESTAIDRSGDGEKALGKGECFPLQSMRWRLVGSYVLVALLATLVVGTLAILIVNRYFAQQEQAHLSQSARLMAKDVVGFLWPEPRLERLRSLVDGYVFLGRTRLVVLSSDRKPLADSGAMPWARAQLMTALEITQRLVAESETAVPLRYRVYDAGRRGSIIRVLPLPGSPGTALKPGGVGARVLREEESSELSRITLSVARVTEPVIGPGGDIVGYIQLSERPDYRSEVVGSLVHALVWAGLTAMAIASATGWFMSRNLTAPLRALGGVARRMESGDLSARAETERQDEIGELATQFNAMAERLEDSFQVLAEDRDALRGFVADAAHELRTPITALKTFNELLTEQGEADAAARGEFLCESKAQIERLDWLTKNLMDLSKMDAGLLGLDVLEHDLGQVVHRALLSFRPQAKAAGIKLSGALPQGPVLVDLDVARVHQVLTNLLSNALKFTPGGGSVTVGMRTTDEHAAVWIQDTGLGIPREELPHIFERFYRGGQGRTRGGSGLGLAIVRGIVEAHGGQVWAESQPGEGSCFTFQLPRQRVQA